MKLKKKKRVDYSLEVELSITGVKNSRSSVEKYGSFESICVNVLSANQLRMIFQWQQYNRNRYTCMYSTILKIYIS